MIQTGFATKSSTPRWMNEDDWYTRYEHYHPYCSTPADMSKRNIPDLIDDKRVGETRLVHATAILRHGARTPWGAGLNCWDGYDTNPETGVWDCNLTAYLSPPPPERVSEEGADDGTDIAMFLFEKRYDALQIPEHNISNFLRGTCQLGQLLLQGYRQEYLNGKFLRDAYAYDESKYDHNARMRLLNIGTRGSGYVWDDVYYRVDDEARTLMSGQVVLRALFGPELDIYFNKWKQYPVIPLHTADFKRDIVDPNEDICPRLVEIRTRNEQSSSYQAFNQSQEAQTLREFQKNILKIPDLNRDMDAIDCLMTTMCTDRPLPDSVNDYKPTDNDDASDNDGDRNLQEDEIIEEVIVEGQEQEQEQQSSQYGSNLFERLYEFDVEKYVRNIKANDSEYSKLSLGPLWYEIMKNIKPYIKEEIDLQSVKLAVFSGHDTTIMPILAALSPDAWGDTDWPPYASMVIIEIHEVNIDGSADRTIYKSNFAFRLIYNGQVITSKMEGCPEDADLCDADILIQRVDGFAVTDVDCQRKHGEPIEYYTDAVSRTKEILSTTEGIIYFLVLVIGSAAFGGLSVYMYLTNSIPRPRRRRNRHDPAYSPTDGVSLTTNGHERYLDDNEEVGMNATLS